MTQPQLLWFHSCITQMQKVLQKHLDDLALLIVRHPHQHPWYPPQQAFILDFKVVHHRYRDYPRGGTVTITVVLSPPNPNDALTSRQIQVSVNGTALPVIEGLGTTPTFTANPGDVCAGTVTDVNAVGSAPVSPVFTKVIPAATVPQQGFILDFVATP